MGVPETVAKRVAELPPAKQAEVLDFVEFLAARTTGAPQASTDWPDRAFRELALQALATEADPVSYTMADCRDVG